ncbi:hypothetical protein FKP32DRAFT_719111 [Trametes sanguinea]|nr:hypothetical protein FKP32DRAFT_719111 [Trametes sanguinea]
MRGCDGVVRGSAVKRTKIPVRGDARYAQRSRSPSVKPSTFDAGAGGWACTADPGVAPQTRKNGSQSRTVPWDGRGTRRAWGAGLLARAGFASFHASVPDWLRGSLLPGAGVSYPSRGCPGDLSVAVRSCAWCLPGSLPFARSVLGRVPPQSRPSLHQLATELSSSLLGFHMNGSLRGGTGRDLMIDPSSRTLSEARTFFTRFPPCSLGPIPFQPRRFPRTCSHT